MCNYLPPPPKKLGLGYLLYDIQYAVQQAATIFYYKLNSLYIYFALTAFIWSYSAFC